MQGTYRTHLIRQKFTLTCKTKPFPSKQIQGTPCSTPLMVIFRGESSEIRLGIIAAALEQLLYFLPVGLKPAQASPMAFSAISGRRPKRHAQSQSPADGCPRRRGCAHHSLRTPRRFYVPQREQAPQFSILAKNICAMTVSSAAGYKSRSRTAFLSPTLPLMLRYNADYKFTS